MKKIFIILFALGICAMEMFAQVPQGVNYQSVARDHDGNILSNQSLTFQITLRDAGGEEGVQYYQEVHRVSTDKMGLVNFAIGQGTPTDGTFEEIPWGKGNVWIDLAIDENGGDNFTIAGSNQLLSVPYAFHANTAGKLVDVNAENARSGEAPTPGYETGSLAAVAGAGECECASGISRLKVLYTGADIVDVEVKKSPPTTISLHAAVKDGDIFTVDASSLPGGKMNSTTTFNIFYSSPAGTESIVIPTHCGEVIVGKTFGPFSILSQTDANTSAPSTCTVCDEPNFWNLKGNAILEACNRIGSLTHEDVVLISDNKDRGVMTKDGDFGLGTQNPKSRLHIVNDGGAHPGGSDPREYGLMLESPEQGMIIKLTSKAGRTDLDNDPSFAEQIDFTNQPDNNNHFLTFMGNSGVPLGRIEGENDRSAEDETGDFFNDADWKLEYDEREEAHGFAIANAVFSASYLTIALSESATLVVDLTTEIANIAGGATCAATLSDACVGTLIGTTGALQVANYIVKSATAGLNVLTATATLASDISEAAFIGANNNVAYENKVIYRGVVYASGGADYAEWLQKVNLSESLEAGDVVGVNAGKISKSTRGAFEYRVISTNPVVLGNMPAEGKESQYEKVGFLGQVPVKVSGEVRPGDYILPSGNNDGLGMAKNAKDMNIDDFNKIIGRAWSSHVGSGIGKVNVAVGLNSNDISIVAQKQQDEIDYLKAEFAKMQSVLEMLQNDTETTTNGVAISIPTQKDLVFDPAPIRRLMKILQITYQINSALLEKNQIDESSLIHQFLSSPTAADAYVSEITKFMSSHGYSIVSTNESMTTQHNVTIDPAFMNFNPEQMYASFSRMEQAGVANATIQKLIENPEKKDEFITNIRMAQEISKVLMEQ